jgi:molybdopterin biosynthesis enzyme
MAQLTDDCFAFGGKLLPLEEAVARIAERFPVIAGSETVPLAQADGRIAAECLRSTRCRPSPILRSTDMPCATPT